MYKDDEPLSFPIFANPDVGEHYRAGLYQSRAEAELDDILQSSFAGKFQSEQKSESPHLPSDAVAHMNCIAIIDNGNIIPVMNFAEMEPPQTVAQQMALCALAARAIIDGLLEAFARWYNEEDDNGDEGKLLT